MYPSWVTLDLVAYQNVDYVQTLQWVDQFGHPADFSGSAFAMDIAASAGAEPALALESSAGIELTDLADGRITITIAAGALAVGAYVYDLVRISDGGRRELLARGAFAVEQGVTQP